LIKLNLNNVEKMTEKTIYALTDYKGNFEAKFNSIPYRSGMDKHLLKEYFNSESYKIEFIYFHRVSTYEPGFWKEKFVLYTSTEDFSLYYKEFIEDIIIYLELNGAIVIPRYTILRANNNKVFMELLLRQLELRKSKNFPTMVFGCLEEAKMETGNLSFPLVYKQAAGAMSKGVGRIDSIDTFISQLSKISRTKNLFQELKEIVRSYKHKEYIKESKNRKKFILQEFIPNLDGDYKILIFGNKYYVLKRSTKEGDFRASGSGIRAYPSEIPDGLLAYALGVYTKIDVPLLSIDVAYDGKEFHLIEFQGTYFGSFTMTFSKFYWLYDSVQSCFTKIDEESCLEKEYARSISEYIIR